MNTLTTIPLELLYKIIKSLSYQDIMSLRSCCRTLHYKLDLPASSFHVNVCQYWDSFPRYVRTRTPGQIQKIEELRIRSTTLSPQTTVGCCIVVLESLRYLRNLRIISIDLDEDIETPQLFESLAVNLPLSTEELELRSSFYSNRDRSFRSNFRNTINEKNWKFLIQMPRLKVLKLADIGPLNVKVVRLISELRLQRLDITLNSTICKLSTTLRVNDLIKNWSLKSLNLCNLHLTINDGSGKMGESIFKQLATLKLEELRLLRCTGLGDNEFRDLKMMSMLRVLELEVHQGYSIFPIDGSAKLVNLTSLRLRYIDPYRGYGNNPSLESVNLGTKLERLEIPHIGFHPRQLMNLLERMPNLVSLTIGEYTNRTEISKLKEYMLFISPSGFEPFNVVLQDLDERASRFGC